MMNVGVIGAGAWGTAFAVHLARKGYSVLLWVYEKDLCATLKSDRENSLFLPGVSLSPAIRFSTSLEAVADFAEDIVLATPSFALRHVAAQLGERLRRKNILILTKGLERDTLHPMSDVVASFTADENSIAVLSGPSFAKEVARGAFTAVVAASANIVLARYFQSAFHDDNFRVYVTDDVIGVELGGALKNVMAIGAGVIEGLGLGTNTSAAFVTRALAEMKRLGRAIGAREVTFMGLSGIGDLILTSYGELSRNRQFGRALARGGKAAEIVASQNTVVEGYYTVEAVKRLSEKLGVAMPITDELYSILHEGKDLALSIEDLTRREFKEEDY